jgi:hypothetical protein
MSEFYPESGFYKAAQASAGPFKVAAFIDKGERPADNEVGFSLFVRLAPKIELSAEEFGDSYLPDLPTFVHKVSTPQAIVYRTLIDYGDMPFGELKDYLPAKLHRFVTEIDQIDTGLFFA